MIAQIHSRYINYRPIYNALSIWLVVIVIALLQSGYAVADPTNTTYDRAIFAAVNGNSAEAITLFQSLVGSNDRKPLVLSNLAILLARAGRASEAESAFRKALELQSNRRINTAFAEFLLTQNRAAEALTFAQRGINDKRAEGNVTLGRVYKKMGNSTEARAALQESLTRNPRNSVAIEELLPILIETGDYETAARVTRAAIAEFPEGAALYWYGIAIEHQDHQPDAKRQFEKYLSIYPHGKYRDQCIEHLKTINPTVDYTSSSEARIQTYLKQPASPMGDRVFSPGRKWVYQISWKFFTLGSMTVESVRRTVQNNRPVWLVRTTIKSNPSIPLIKIDDVYESYVDADFRYTNRYWTVYAQSGRYDQKVYECDLEHGSFVANCVDDNGYLYFVEKDLPLDAYDGISVLTWARRVVSSNRAGKAITMIDEEFKYSTVLPGFTDEKISVGGTKYETKKFNAQVNYIGIAGLTGKATGWITSNADALPVRALFEITIGSIDIHLQRIEG